LISNIGYVYYKRLTTLKLGIVLLKYDYIYNNNVEYINTDLAHMQFAMFSNLIGIGEHRIIQAERIYWLIDWLLYGTSVDAV